tara:strand:+ start:493 stop:927 length:435 start_codon:yes stop_codon:yes gene_type:complete
MAYKGKYKPQNPQKYNGDSTKIIYRSLWERTFMVFCDTQDTVISWSSELIVVPYISPIDNKFHRYFVDFLVTTKNKKGHKETLLIEVKPKKQCLPPKKKKRMTKSYLCDLKNWGINSSKWKAAKEFAENRGWKFKILTEDTLQR